MKIPADSKYSRTEKLKRKRSGHILNQHGGIAKNVYAWVKQCAMKIYTNF